MYDPHRIRSWEHGASSLWQIRHGFLQCLRPVASLVFLKILKVRVPFCQHFSSQLFVIGVAQHQPTTFYHAQQWMRYAEDYLDTMRKELLAVNHSPSEGSCRGAADVAYGGPGEPETGTRTGMARRCAKCAALQLGQQHALENHHGCSLRNKSRMDDSLIYIDPDLVRGFCSHVWPGESARLLQLFQRIMVPRTFRWVDLGVRDPAAARSPAQSWSLGAWLRARLYQALVKGVPKENLSWLVSKT